MMVRKAAAGRASGAGFVLSDASVDRYGDVVEPAGWELSAFKRNPIALFNHRPDQVVGRWTNVRVAGDELVGDFQAAEPGTSRIADEVRRLVDQGLLKAASVGFRGLKSEPIDTGTRFIKQELVEVSLVSVPANPAALAQAKGMGISEETMAAVFGVHAEKGPPVVTKAGVHAEKPPRTGGRPMNISKQIEDVQTRLNAARDELLEHTREPDHEPEKAETLNNEIELLERDLASKQRTEKSLALRAQEAVAATVPAVPRRPLGVSVPEVKSSDYLWRAAAAQFIAYANRRGLEEVIRERYSGDAGYPDHEKTAWTTRAAVLGALTSVPAWAGDLVQQGNADWLAGLRPPPVFTRLAAMGTALTFGPNQGTIKIPSRAATPSITGSFIAEAAPIPVRKLGVTSIALSPHKLGVISVFSREMAAYSNPSIESIIREGIADDTSLTVDTLLLDATASSTARPAGLLFGISTAGTASTAKGAAAILADLAMLTAPFAAANAGRNLALIINPTQGMQLEFAPGPDGTMGWTSPITNRYTVIETTVVAAGTVIMIDAADFVSASGAPEFDISEQATLHMEDTTPLNIGTVGTPAVVAAPVYSMYQTAQIAIRMLQNMTWAMRRTGMVQYITGANWGP